MPCILTNKFFAGYNNNNYNYNMFIVYYKINFIMLFIYNVSTVWPYYIIYCLQKNENKNWTKNALAEKNSENF